MCLLERCPHFRGCIYSVYIQCVQELGPEDVSLYIREVSSFQMVYIIYRLQIYMHNYTTMKPFHKDTTE